MKVDPIRIKDIRERNKSAGIEDINYLVAAVDQLYVDKIEVALIGIGSLISTLSAFSDPADTITIDDLIDMLEDINRRNRTGFTAVIDGWLAEAGAARIQ